MKSVDPVQGAWKTDSGEQRVKKIQTGLGGGGAERKETAE